MNAPIPVAMVIADISGYTSFMVQHAKALSHSQQIVTELLDTITCQAVGLLKVSKLEGDAVFMYAPKNQVSHDLLRRELGDRIQAIFQAYNAALGVLEREMFCVCAACQNVGALRLKVVVHSGTAVLTEYNYTDLQGVDPIVIHRLLKNKVDAHEYLLLTDSGRADVLLPEAMALTEGLETYADIGQVRVWVAASDDLHTHMECEIRPMAEMSLPYDILRDEIKIEYGSVAIDPSRDFHFHVGRQAADTMEYGPDDLAGAPKQAVDTFLGTGNPMSMGRMPEGGHVVDIGCGSGLDVSIAARQVGPDGLVVGVDMTEEMLDKSRRLFADWSNVEIREGFAEHLPVEDGWADVVISNGVFNLCPNKPAVLAEMFRVLKPGGRLQIGDIMVPRPLRPDQRKDIDLWKG